MNSNWHVLYSPIPHRPSVEVTKCSRVLKSSPFNALTDQKKPLLFDPAGKAIWYIKEMLF